MQNSLSISFAQTEANIMTSREIAELTGKQHAHVMRDIRSMMDAFERNPDLDFVCNTTTYGGSNGQEYDQYELDKDACLTLLLGYDPVSRMRVVKRWQELEAGKFQVPTTLSGALRLASEQAEKIEQQAAQLAIAAPKVEFVEKYVSANTGSVGLRQVCKLLGAKQNDFTAFLIARQFMYRTTPKSPLQPRAEHMHSGRFEAKAGVAEHAESSHAFVNYRFTPKGFEWIAGEWAKFKAREMVEYGNHLL